MHTLKQKDTHTPGENTMRLPTFVRFSDLVEAGIVGSWMQLTRMIDCEGFPQGVRLSRNIRAWEITEVRTWLKTRPATRKVIPRKQQNQEQEEHA